MEEVNNDREEITLKEIILKIKDFIFEVVKNWWILVIFIALGIGYYLYKHYNHIITYQSEIRFVVEGQRGGGRGLSSLLGSFGIRKGGGASPSKILEVAKSSNIMKLVLLDSIANNQRIGNYLISKFSKHPKFKEDFSEIEGYRFSEYSKPLNRQDASLLKQMQYFFWNKEYENTFCNISFDKDSGIYSLRTKTISDSLSHAINQKIYENLKNFFENKIFEKQLSAAKILKFKADSLKSLMVSKTYQIARFKDQNHGLVSREDKARSFILSGELEAVTSAYSEIIKNYELTDFNLKDLQPLFIEIEPSYLPLSPKRSSFSFMFMYGCIVGSMLGVAFIIGRRIFIDIMK